MKFWLLWLSLRLWVCPSKKVSHLIVDYLLRLPQFFILHDFHSKSTTTFGDAKQILQLLWHAHTLCSLERTFQTFKLKHPVVPTLLKFRVRHCSLRLQSGGLPHSHHPSVHELLYLSHLWVEWGFEDKLLLVLEIVGNHCYEHTFRRVSLLQHEFVWIFHEIPGGGK